MQKVGERTASAGVCTTFTPHRTAACQLGLPHQRRAVCQHTPIRIVFVLCYLLSLYYRGRWVQAWSRCAGCFSLAQYTRSTKGIGPVVASLGKTTE